MNELTFKELPALISVGQAARLTGLDARYLRKLREAGQIRSYKLMGGTHRLVKRDLARHLNLEEEL